MILERRGGSESSNMAGVTIPVVSERERSTSLDLFLDLEHAFLGHSDPEMMTSAPTSASLPYAAPPNKNHIPSEKVTPTTTTILTANGSGTTATATATATTTRPSPAAALAKGRTPEQSTVERPPKPGMEQRDAWNGRGDAWSGRDVWERAGIANHQTMGSSDVTVTSTQENKYATFASPWSLPAPQMNTLEPLERPSPDSFERPSPTPTTRATGAWMGGTLNWHEHEQRSPVKAVASMQSHCATAEPSALVTVTLSVRMSPPLADTDEVRVTSSLFGCWSPHCTMLMIRSSAEAAVWELVVMVPRFVNHFEYKYVVVDSKAWKRYILTSTAPQLSGAIRWEQKGKPHVAQLPMSSQQRLSLYNTVTRLQDASALKRRKSRNGRR